MAHLRLLPLMLLLSACPSDPTDATDDDCWWCEDTDSGSIDGSDSETETETETKPDKGGYMDWTGALDPDSGLGTLGYTALSDDGKSYCSLSYAITSATPSDSCEECSAAWKLVYGTMSIIKDGGLCEAGMGLEGAPVYLGYDAKYTVYGSKNGEQWAPIKGASGGAKEGQWQFRYPHVK